MKTVDMQCEKCGHVKEDIRVPFSYTLSEVYTDRECEACGHAGYKCVVLCVRLGYDRGSEKTKAEVKENHEADKLIRIARRKHTKAEDKQRLKKEHDYIKRIKTKSKRSY